MATVDSGPLLSVRDLAISYTTSEGTFTAVEGVEFGAPGAEKRKRLAEGKGSAESSAPPASSGEYDF